MEQLLFSQLNVSEEIQKAITAMGFEYGTPIQSASIPVIMQGGDVIAQAPTGTGKTCAFGIPLIEKIDQKDSNVQGLILCPTRELVIQTTLELTKLSQFKPGIKIVAIYGGQQIQRQFLALRRRPQIIVATPGRMMDHLRRKTVRIENLTTIILDEADEMLNMGFREDIDIILDTVPEKRQTVLFSATLSRDILDIAKRYLTNPATIKVAQKELTVPNIEQYYVEVQSPKKMDALTRLIDVNEYKLCLVFCNTKRMVEQLTDGLSAKGYSAQALHGDLRQMQRDKVMSGFRSGHVKILVATDVAARGIDVDNIEAVFNYDLPTDEEYYVHRIGRTGRVGRKGASYTFISGRELYKLREIMRYTKAEILPLKAPGAAQVKENAIKNLCAQIDTMVEKNSLEIYGTVLQSIISGCATTVTAEQVAAALLKINMSDTFEVPVVPEFQKVKPTVKRDDNSRKMARFFVSAGKMDSITANHFVAMICDNTGMTGDMVGSIDIHDKFSFIEVPASCADQTEKALNSLQFNGRPLRAEKAGEKNAGAGKYASKSSGGGSATYGKGRRNFPPRKKTDPKA